jgi:hypothetical protein
LNAAECRWINCLGTSSPLGYNIREGGGSRGRLSEQTKRRMSESKRGRKQDPAQVERRVSSLRGRKRSPEVCAHLSEVLRGRKITWGDKISRTRRLQGVHLTDSQKAALDARRRRPRTAEERQNMSKYNPCRKLSDDDVHQIRQMGSEGVLSQREIGERFGVKQVAVGRILRGVSFRWL